MRSAGRVVAVGMLVILGAAGCARRPAPPAPGATAGPAAVIEDTGIGQVKADVVPSFSLYPFTASRSQGIVHRTSCPLVAAVPGQDRQFFRSATQAVQAGFKPCPKCLPDRQ
jgi:hypothetical protein